MSMFLLSCNFSESLGPALFTFVPNILKDNWIEFSFYQNLVLVIGPERGIKVRRRIFTISLLSSSSSTLSFSLLKIYHGFYYQ